MQVTPMDEKDLPSNLLEKGEYLIEVVEAKDAISKTSQNEMISLKIAVWVGDKIRCYLFDYLLDSLPAKVRHACDTFGLLDKYQAGSLSASDFFGRSGTAKIGVEIDKTGKYPDKNKITDYVTRPSKPIGSSSRNNNTPPPTDDDLPF